MPLINGMKMACEPCIRGHRSTKCTHANERLMVPVKKPGRPLSACPHLHGQLCGCSSVTAAIPRKQKCHCGTSTAVQPQPVTSTISDVPSPTKAAFRVQKPPLSSRPGSRRQSYDQNNLERMEAGNLNIVPFQSLTAQAVLTPAITNGYTTSVTHILYTNGLPGPEFPNPLLQSCCSNFSIEANPANGAFPADNSVSLVANGSYLPLESLEGSFVGSEAPSGGASCCAPKPAASNGDVAVEARSHVRKEFRRGCCSSKGLPDLSSHDSMSSESTPAAPIANGFQGMQQYPFPTNFNVNQPVYTSSIPHTTVYAYPPSYGSYQHPLQPSEWRRSVMSNMYTQPTLQPQALNDLTGFNSTADPLPNLDTFHACSCGHACQCIGCAAHPYNDATQDYIRSAYKIAHEQSSPTTADFTDGHSTANGTAFSPIIDPMTIHADGNDNSHGNGENLSQILAETPSDTGTAEEQTLSAADYFFVNYPFSSEGCHGNTNSCPCGDDCECIGCTIHRLDGPALGLSSESLANGHIHVKEDGPEPVSRTAIKGEDTGDG